MNRLLLQTIVTTVSIQMSATTLSESMIKAGLVDVGAMDSTIVVDLMYSRDNNFTGVRLYTDGLDKAYLHPSAARAVVKASETLAGIDPSLRLKICDAARPMSVQRLMYKVVRGTAAAPYVSNPANGGGLHNYGLAIDITIVDSLGNELPMGTKVDHLGREANIDREPELVARGVITEQELQNRLLLRKVMRAAGFKPLRSEWWHFNLCTRNEARRNYRRLDF